MIFFNCVATNLRPSESFMAYLGEIKKDEDVVSMVSDTKWPRLRNVAGWEDIQEDY